MMSLLVLPLFSCSRGYPKEDESSSYSESVIDFDLNGGTSVSYDGPKTVQSISKDDFFFDCVKEGWNFRGWSYDGAKVFDEKGASISTPTMASRMTFVADYAQTSKISIAVNMPEAGEVTGEGEYPYNSSVDLSASPYPGYDFVGWYYGDAPLSMSEDYKCVIGEEDIELTAVFELKSFCVEVVSDNDECGLVSLEADARQRFYSSYSRSLLLYKSDVSVAAYSKSDVRFLGWYDEGNSLISSNAVYSFSMPSHDCYLAAKWDLFKISYNLNGGTQNPDNPTSYTTGSGALPLYAPTKAGYTFLGWRYGSDFVSSIDPSLFRSVTLDAVWEAVTYSVSYHLDGGANDPSNPSSYTVESDDISFASPSKAGYVFEGWYSDPSFENKVTSIKKGSYGDMNLYAKWSIITYSIFYNLNGGTQNGSNPTSYTVEDAIPLAAPTKAGYTFLGWYDGENKVTSIEKGTTGSLSLTAEWSANLNSLSVTSEDESKGTAEIVSGTGYSGETITVKATPADGFVFIGWYRDSEKVSEKATYSFTMPFRDCSLVARFYGGAPLLDEANGTLAYGLYPQTHVSDSATIAALDSLKCAEINGWYLYDGQYYAKETAEPYGSDYVFDDGTNIVSGTSYWFKCEPIVWKTLSSDDGNYSLVSSLLLDAHRYNEYYSGLKDGYYANNYANSQIREWLNGDFYSAAFALGDSYVQTTTVDNSAATTYSSDNKYACEDTEDKVYLLSYQDYYNTSYFADNVARQCKTTDYARARGACCSTNSSYLYNGYDWTRSPYSGGSSFVVWGVNVRGDLFLDGVESSSCAFRPAISITL